MTEHARQPEIEAGEYFSLLKKEFRPRTAEAKEAVEHAVLTLAQQALAQTTPIRGDVIESIKAIIAQLDKKLTEQINEIQHHSSFQRLEGTWRGLWFLCSQSEAREMVTIKVLNVTPRELVQDARASFFESTLVRRIYVDETATPTGTPYTAILADFYFDLNGDYGLLNRLAAIGELATVLVVGCATPTPFGLTSFREIAEPSRLTISHEASESWRHFRHSNAARFVSLVLPRVLMREPYQGKPANADYDHWEDTSAPENFLWASAVWVLGDSIVRSYIHDGWFAGVSGARPERLADELPRYALPDDSGDTLPIGPTEYQISYAREKEIAELGFTPVVNGFDGAIVVNFARTSYQEEALDRTGTKRTRQSFPADLRGMLCACRFAQAITRLAPHSTERALQNWLDTYVAPSDRPSDAARPLRLASIRLEQVQSKKFARAAVLRIWPAYQFDVAEPIDFRVPIQVSYPRPTEAEDPSLSSVDHEDAKSPKLNRESFQPFQLLSATPCRESHVALEAFWRSLEQTAFRQHQMAFRPLTVDAVVDATRPIDELVEWVCREDWQLDIEIADTPQRIPLSLPRLGFLVRYPSGIVRGLSAEIDLVGGRYRLAILDPLAVLDPGNIVSNEAREPIRCRFDVLVLEATDHDQT